MLELRGVHAGYGDMQVLEGIDLVVEPGEALALIGPNGVGKTTTLRVASGLLTPVSGEVTLGGAVLSGPAEAAGAGLCHIPEGRGIFRSLTVRQNLRLFGPPDDTAAFEERSISTFPCLGQRLGQPAGTLSGGEQQMLALTRAFAPTVSMLLIDEASLGLAPIVVDEIFDVISTLRRNGMSLVLVEQYVERALSIADTVVVLRRGRIALHTKASDVDADQLAREYLVGT